MLLENATKYESELRDMGRRAIERARKAGALAYYMDPSLGDGIIRELPDGTRQKVQITRGQDIVLETFPPAR